MLWKCSFFGDLNLFFRDIGSPTDDVNKNCVKVLHKDERSFKFFDENCSVKLPIVCQIDLSYDSKFE